MSKINSGTTVYASHCRAERKAIAFLKEAKPQQQCNNVITRLEQQLHPSIGQTDRQLNAIMLGTMAEVRWKKIIIRLT
jgi:hypothetical protein